MAVWFTSDTHFGHRNILKYQTATRPFVVDPNELATGEISDASVEAMNEALVANWNSVVAPGDLVYHLGDFALGPKENVAKWRARLNGKIVLVAGNHDRKADFMRQAGFEEVVSEMVVREDGIALYLHHQPVFNTARWQSAAQYHLCGHMHDQWARRVNIINVGVDVSGLKPISLDQLLIRDLEQCRECLDTPGRWGSRPCPECYGWTYRINERNGKREHH